MEALKLPFLVLQSIGVWRPLHRSSKFEIFLYGTYSLFVTFLMLDIILSQTFELLYTARYGAEAFANKSFFLLTSIADFGKGLCIWIKRNEIIELTNILEKDPCLAATEEESTIKRKFDELIRTYTLRYGSLVGFTVLGMILFVKDLPPKSFLYDRLLLFEHSDYPLVHLIVYNLQVFAMITSAVITVGFHTLVPSLMLQTCAQLNLLKERFREMPNRVIDKARNCRTEDPQNLFGDNLEGYLIARCVKHHIEIFHFAEKSNEIFGGIIFLQYTMSTIVLCVSAYEFTNVQLFTMEFTALFMYLICACVQIFTLCFFGSEVTRESLNLGDAIYQIEWNRLREKRSLLTIMARTLRPIEYTSGHVITLNLDQFTNLLKLSYSAYNVLQQSS